MAKTPFFFSPSPHHQFKHTDVASKILEGIKMENSFMCSNCFLK